MKLKYPIVMVLFTTVLFLTIPTSHAAPNPHVYIDNIEPQPASPGDTVRVYLVVQNRGDTEGEFQPINVETEDNIQLIGNRWLESNFEVCGGCQKAMKFYLKVSEDAISGSHPVEFELLFVNSDTKLVKNVVIEVDGKPNLIASTEQVKVPQGDETTFTLEVTNIGTDVSTQTVVNLENPQINFDPSTIYMGELQPGETAREEVKIRTGEDIKEGPSKVQMKFKYQDDSKSIKKNSSFSAYVLKNAEITLSHLQAEDIYIGSESRILVELENTGSGKASKLNSKLSCDNAEVQDSKAFVGSLDSDESIPTVYHIVPSSENLECSVIVNYMDYKSKSLEESFELKASRKESNILSIFIGLLVLIVVAIYFWKVRGRDETEEV